MSKSNDTLKLGHATKDELAAVGAIAEMRDVRELRDDELEKVSGGKVQFQDFHIT